jgi:4-diphosphocytidyl-2-C-methyl-D-erythritol kinase
MAATNTQGWVHGAAPAKINLTLLVTGKRADGYHLLDSLVVFAAAHDRLSVTPANDLTLEITGPFATALKSTDPKTPRPPLRERVGPSPKGGEGEGYQLVQTQHHLNLVLRAARALAAAHGIHAGARIRLEKNLPVASGIGGGSSDAAAALRLLSQLWHVNIPDGLAATLGADVPVCLDPVPRHMAGIGEVLTPAPRLPACGIALVNPGLALSTKAVFEAREARFSMPASLPVTWPDTAAMAADLANWGNDLEAPALKLCPAVGSVLEALRTTEGCRIARMSGSGATCFALFDRPALAEAAALHAARPGWWCWGGPLWPADPTPGLYAAPAAT